MPRKSKYCPGDELLPYQRKWVDDHSRWKFGLWSRQTGKDFSSGFEGISECVTAEAGGEKVDWLIAAPSERQALESLMKWKDWATAFKATLADQKELREGGSQSLLKSAMIMFPHGSRVIAVPGKPDTVRGFSANVLLTEFAFFEQPDATWRAILPSITNSLRGGVKKVRLITTPNGIGNKAYDIWSKNYRGEGAETKFLTRGNGDNGEKERAKATAGSPVWACHFVPITKAVEQGLPVNIEELREAINDPEGWAQEFDCEFLDAQAVLLPYELIATCESPEACEVCPIEFWQANPVFPLVMGIDFGRHRDLTCAWTLGKLGDVLQTQEVLTFERTSTPSQVEALRPRIARCQRVCLDYTGAGIGLGDYLVKEFGEWKPESHRFGKIELLTFGNTTKVDVFSKLRMAFEKRGVRVPISRAVREDLHSLSRVTGPSGQLTYRASHTPDGHADRCTALALAVRAGGNTAVPMRMERAKVVEGIGNMGMGRVSREVWM